MQQNHLKTLKGAARTGDGISTFKTIPSPFDCFRSHPRAGSFLRDQAGGVEGWRGWMGWVLSGYPWGWKSIRLGRPPSLCMSSSQSSSSKVLVLFGDIVGSSLQGLIIVWLYDSCRFQTIYSTLIGSDSSRSKSSTFIRHQMAMASPHSPWQGRAAITNLECRAKHRCLWKP